MISERFTGPLPNRIARFDDPPALLKFTRSGYTLDFYRKNGRAHQEGYDSPENFFRPSHWWAHDYTTTRDPAQLEGIPWLDIREAVETPEGRRWVFTGPLCDPKLADGQVDDLEVQGLTCAGLISGGGEFAALLTMQAAHKATDRKKPGPLDSVSVAEYVRGWIAHGARGGIIRGGEFVQEPPR